MISAYSLMEEIVDILYGTGYLKPEYLEDAKKIVFKVCQDQLNEPDDTDLYIHMTVDEYFSELNGLPELSEKDFFRTNGW